MHRFSYTVSEWLNNLTTLDLSLKIQHIVNKQTHRNLIRDNVTGFQLGNISFHFVFKMVAGFSGSALALCPSGPFLEVVNCLPSCSCHVLSI